MENTRAVLQLLQEKCDLFVRFDEKTQQMLDCPVEEMERLVSEREDLIDRIRDIDGRVAQHAAESGMPDALAAAARCGGNRSDLPQALHPVYDMAAKIRTIVSRLTETETQVGLRARLEQQRALEQIKNTNRGVGAQAAKFSVGGQDGPKDGFQITKA